MPKNFQEMGWQHWLKTGNYSGDWMVLQEVQPHRCGDFLWEAFVLFFWCIVNVGLGRSPCCLLWHRGFTINIDIKSRVLFIYLWIYFYFYSDQPWTSCDFVSPPPLSVPPFTFTPIVLSRVYLWYPKRGHVSSLACPLRIKIQANQS